MHQAMDVASQQQQAYVRAPPHQPQASDQSLLSMAPSNVPSMSTSCQDNNKNGSFKNLFSAGLPRNTSLVFDIELEDGGVGASWQEADSWDDDEVVSEVQRFVQPVTPAEQRLVSDVRASLSHCSEGQDMPRLAQILTALGYRVQLRTALGGGDGADCLRNLRHTFLAVTLANVNQQQVGARRYIVDPQFKEQFIIAKATARYCAILAAVPAVLVAPEDHLVLLVNFLCTEMSLAFRQLGSVLPPWRHASSVLSKWRPRKSVDEAVAPGGGASGAAGGGMGLQSNAAASTAAATSRQHVVAQQIMMAGRNGGGMNVAQQQQQQANNMQQRWQQLQAQLQRPASKALESSTTTNLNNLNAGSSFVFNPMPMSTNASSSSGSANFEPLRVYLGGNFIPINPQPTATAQAW